MKMYRRRVLYRVVCSQEKSTSIVLSTNIKCQKDCFRFVRFCGLQADKLYKNSHDDKAYYGDYYMSVGLNLSIEWHDEFQVRLIVAAEA